MERRDNVLDIIKGLACILMILAHSKTVGRTIDNTFTTYMWNLGFFAPAFFFGGVGHSLYYQIKKRPKFQIVLLYVLLFVMSLADQGKLTHDYLSLKTNYLFPSMATSAIICVYLLPKNNIFITFIPEPLNLILNRLPLPLTQLHGLGFAVIPWISFMLLGDYLNKHKQHALPIFFVNTVIVAYWVVVKKYWLLGQVSTPLFMSMGFALYSLAFYFASNLNRVPGVSRLVRYLGKYSLLFFWSHSFLIYSVPIKLAAPIVWFLVLVASTVLMYCLQYINKLTISKVSVTYPFWLVILVAIFIPALCTFTPQVQFFYFYCLLFIFALNYHNFLTIFNNRTVSEKISRIPA